MSKADHLPLEQIDGINRSLQGGGGTLFARPGKQSHSLQDRRDRNIKYSVRPSMHLDSGFQHAESPGVDADRPIKGFPVEAADVTVRIMKAISR